jgi:hypothetical protein
MIVASMFSGDNNSALMQVQSSVYGEMLGRLFMAARERYLAAASLLGVENALSERLRTMDNFDHRTLQVAHDHIAAFFRFSRDDGGQLQLDESDENYFRRLEETWREFLQSEIRQLTADDEFTRSVCKATAFGNNGPGYAAEDWLDQFLRDRYRERGLDL